KQGAAIRLLDFLKPENILLDIKSSDKSELLKEFVDILMAAESPEIRLEIVQALLDREKLGSTGIGSGVAVPHAKSNRANQIHCAMGISKKGVEFEAMDKSPVHIVFLLVAPPNSQSEHLNILARIVRLLKDRVFRQALRESKNKEEVLKLIAAEDV
ncbi:MAG: PTS sugar transporter subunit IIA, partial [Elusimicrobia bacterium]|nr:PTS sugar transporter subunit IIA [Elusimicrobiota bacterium]